MEKETGKNPWNVLEEVKQEPESPKAEQNIPESSMDEQKKSQFVCPKNKENLDVQDNKGYVGAIWKLYYCTICET